MIHYVYVVDDLENEKLLGIADLQAIIQADPDACIEDIMRRDVQTVPPTKMPV